MKLPKILSSTVLIATAILGMNSPVYGQCQGDWCPIPNAYHDNNAPSQYGYDKPNQNNQNQNHNWQGNPNWQGNQNPNWQGNQNPNWRNDNGWRGGETSYSTPNAAYYHYGQNISSQNPPGSGMGANYYSQNLSGNFNDQKESSDKLIQSRIEDALRNNHLKTNYGSVTSRVYNGNVTLSGYVQTEDDRQDVESRVRNVNGVKNINDQLTVNPGINQIGDSDPNFAYPIADTAGKASDFELQKQVDDTLKNNYVKKNFDTVVATVANGTVTLSGVVDNDKDRQDIRDRLQKISGITDVNDRLQVAGSKTSYNSYKKPAFAN